MKASIILPFGFAAAKRFSRASDVNGLLPRLKQWPSSASTNRRLDRGINSSGDPSLQFRGVDGLDDPAKNSGFLSVGSTGFLCSGRGGTCACPVLCTAEGWDCTGAICSRLACLCCSRSSRQSAKAWAWSLLSCHAKASCFCCLYSR